MEVEIYFLILSYVYSRKVLDVWIESKKLIYVLGVSLVRLNGFMFFGLDSIIRLNLFDRVLGGGIGNLGVEGIL